MTRASSRLSGLIICLGIIAMAARAEVIFPDQPTLQGASRASYFQRVIEAAKLRGDPVGMDHLRRLAAAPPALPPDLKPLPDMTAPQIDYVGRYRLLRKSLKEAMFTAAGRSLERWRVYRAEADLQLVAWELRKGRAASTALLDKYIRDAAWALERHTGAVPPPQPPTATIAVEPARVLSGREVTITWRAENADSAFINDREVPLAGSEKATVTAASEFVLIAACEDGDTSARATVSVFFPPTARIACVPDRSPRGGEITVKWLAAHAASATINGEPVPPEGMESVPVEVSSEFVLQVEGEGGTAADRARVHVFDPPTAAIEVTPTAITAGETALLAWRTAFGEQTALNGQVVEAVGERPVSPAQDQSWTVTVVGANGRAEARASLAVAPPPPRRFLVHFDFDEWAIRADAVDTMNQVAALMRANPEMNMKIVGHTDGQGTDSYNLALSLRRANAVRAYVLAHFGLDPSRFIIEVR